VKLKVKSYISNGVLWHLRFFVHFSIRSHERLNTHTHTEKRPCSEWVCVCEIVQKPVTTEGAGEEGDFLLCVESKIFIVFPRVCTINSYLSVCVMWGPLTSRQRIQQPKRQLLIWRV